MTDHRTGNLQSYSFDIEDIYWGQLSGCLESIDAGTTTVVDHAHLTYSPEHGDLFSSYHTRPSSRHRLTTIRCSKQGNSRNCLLRSAVLLLLRTDHASSEVGSFDGRQRLSTAVVL